MVKIDLHVHSTFSKTNSHWFLQKFNMKESYTHPYAVYESARFRGMDFVTITDHDSIDGALLLKQKYPDEVIVGVESTVSFPEDSCKIHLLIFGLNKKQFYEIENLRNNIYQLRDYIKQKGLCYSVAHPLYSVDSKISLKHFEKLALLFNVFEGMNGNMNRNINTTLVEALKSLGPQEIDRLYKKHRIEPLGECPWEKKFTGGSDDHGNISIGSTYTVSEAKSTSELLERIKAGETTAEGKHNDYRAQFFMIYKAMLDLSSSSSRKWVKRATGNISQIVFENRPLSLKNRLFVQVLKVTRPFSRNIIHKELYNFLKSVGKKRVFSIDERFSVVYEKISQVTDNIIKSFMKSMEKDLQKFNLAGLTKKFTSSLMGAAVYTPFLTSLKQMNKNRELIKQLQSKLHSPLKPAQKNILLFADRIVDWEKVRIVLRRYNTGPYNIHIVTPFPKPEHPYIRLNVTYQVINIPFIYNLRLPFNNDRSIKIPSLLKSFEQIYRMEPDEIISLTPGPVGFLGILVSKTLSIKSIGMYQGCTSEHIEDRLFGYLMRLYYSQVDELRLTSTEYHNLKELSRVDRYKMSIFPSGEKSLTRLLESFSFKHSF
ncbi:MAG: hypothetical protein ACOC7U_10485 [Spirochaetota bacterium]